MSVEEILAKIDFAIDDFENAQKDITEAVQQLIEETGSIEAARKALAGDETVDDLVITDDGNWRLG